MRRILIGATALAVSVGFVPAASAALSQQAIVKASPTSGTGDPKGKGYVKLDSYLSTRDAASTRGAYKTNPVGKVFMTFPAGGTINKAAGPVCAQSEYTAPSLLKTLCATSVIGTGWAILNNGSTSAQLQLTGTASYCATAEKSTYMATYEGFTSSGPNCLPQGDIWVKVTAYQGAVLKAQWWCYGDAGAPKAGATCNNKQSGGDANGKVLASGPTGGTFNDLTNAKKANGCNIIFANDNGVAPLSFGGVTNLCKNRLTVIIPALNGCSTCLGELPGGIVLTDFALKITKTNYLKAGKCPSNKTWTVSTQVVFSMLKGESGTAPASQTVSSSQKCRV